MSPEIALALLAVQTLAKAFASGKAQEEISSIAESVAKAVEAVFAQQGPVTLKTLEALRVQIPWENKPSPVPPAGSNPAPKPSATGAQ